MLLRSLVVSLLILVSVAAALPFRESLAAYGRRAAASAGRTGKKQARRRTRAWRLRRRAHLRRQRAVAAARRRRQRSWVLRRRATAPRTAAAVKTKPQNLRVMLAPLKLPGASPSAVDSIQSIEASVAAPPKPATPELPVARALAHAAPAPVASPLVGAKPAAAPTPFIAPAPFVKAAPFNNVPVVASAPSKAPVAAPSPFAAPAPFAPARPAAAAMASPPRRVTGLPVPRSWQSVSSTVGGEFKFSVRAANGRATGAAVWSRVAAPAPAGIERRGKTLGGVSLTSLRRTVIDRMIAEGGWVVNDVEREIGGRRVFVVFAQSDGERGTRRNWTYYFTETDGLVYSLATTTSAEFADAVAADAEQTLTALAPRPQQQ